MMKVFTKAVRISSVIILLSASCSRSQIPIFNEIRAFEYLQKQCSYGPRNPGSDGHRRCLQFLVEELQQSADAVVKQPFMHTNPRSKKTHTLTNIISSYGKQGERILLCAHWDTRPWADYDPDSKNHEEPIIGANDGASGVAILLEIARLIKQHPPPRGIDIILFDGEDSGIYGRDESWCVGSRYFARNKRSDYNPRYGILVDMVGKKDLHLPIEINSQTYAPELVDRVWTKAEELNLPAFDRSTGPQMIDDHLELLNVGIPTINIIDFDYPHWHTLQDTEDKCSSESLGIVGKLLLHIIYE